MRKFPFAIIVAVTTSTTPTYAADLLVKKGFQCHRSATGMFIQSQGEVRNTSTRSLPNLQVTVTFRKADGTFVKSDTGYAQFNPLLPDQTSPFSTMGTTNPAIAGCSIGGFESLSTGLWDMGYHSVSFEIEK